MLKVAGMLIMRIARSTLIGTAVAIALFGRNDPGYAQAASDSGAGNDGLEEIVVRGIRASLRESLDTKRNASTIVDAISAEDVGKFPDKNLAEALQRVPGIVINREFGEGERVSLRGTAPNLTRTLLNGHALATADWFILDQLNSTRSFNFLMLPSDIIGQVAVYKSPQADFDEGGIGGTIDVVTRNPLDLDPFTAYGSLQAAYTELSDKTNPQASGLLSWKNEAGTLGILGAAVYQKREIRRDGVEVLGYEDSPGAGTTLIPSLIGSALFQQERVRKGGNLGVQFRPSDTFEANLTGLYSRFNADNINENFLAWGTRALSDGGTLSNTTMVGDTAVAGRIASPTNGTTGFGVVYDAIDRHANATTRNIDLDSKFTLSSTWQAHFKVGFTDADGNTDSQPFVEFGAPAAFSYDLRGKSPSVTFENIDPSNPSDLDLIFGSLHQIKNSDQETYAYADTTFQVDMGMFKSVKLGAKYSDHDRETIFNATTYGGFFVPLNTTGCGGQCSASFFAGGPTPNDFLENISGPGTLSSYWQVNRDVVNSTLFDAFANTAGRIPYPQQQFAVTEKAYAGYVMGNLEGESWKGNLGVRVVKTDQTSSGALIKPDGQVTNAFGNFDPVTVDRSYTDVLPSLNVAYNLQEDLILRFALAKVMARPDFTDIAPRASLNLGALTGSSGNPNIDPYRANQADVSVEYYADRNSVLAVALYYKDVKSFITDSVVTQTFPIQTGTPSALCTPTGTANVFNCPFTVNVRSNGGGGKIKGAEFSATQPIWGGFGVQGNYTYTDAEADNGDPLQGTSKNQFNIAGYFENQRFSTRLAYTYRSDFFVTFDRSTKLNQKALESLDASASVNLTDNVALTFDGVNLTDEKIEQYASDEFRPRAIYDNGRIYFAGVRVKF
jgi:iron complex outermembrane recepter protein